MAALLDAYLADSNPIPIRILDDTIKLVLGGLGRKEGVSLTSYGVLVIDTDGSVAKNDTLKSSFDGADRFHGSWSVDTHRFSEILRSAEFSEYHAMQRPQNAICLACPELGVCGGGMTLHRWSDAAGYDNPSIYCEDQKLLIGRVREKVASFDVTLMSVKSLRLSSLEVFAEPFPYFTAKEGLGELVCEAFLNWLDNKAPWELVETDFYEQYECSLVDVPLPAPLRFFTEPFIDELRLKVEGIFDQPLSERFDCTAHKLAAGQRIRIHNDYIPGGETHRVLIQLNRGWDDALGGYFMLFNSEEVSDVHRVFPPMNDTVVGFAISQQSNHAVSTVHGGERFTIVFSFYAKDSG